MESMSYKSSQEALSFVRDCVDKMEILIKTSDSVIKDLIDQSTRLEIENKHLQDRNDELRAELEALKNDRAS